MSWLERRRNGPANRLMFYVSNRFITVCHNILILLRQRRCVSAQLTAGFALQLVDADVVNPSDLVKHGAVPIDVIDERPPCVTDKGNAFRPQPAHIVNGLFQPLQALAFVAVKARFGEH